EKILSYENSAKNIIEEEARIKYNPDNLFKKKDNFQQFAEHTEETAMVEYNENIFKRIINKILNILRFRKE
ncbi:MAG: hypothetical protein IJV31_08480, partial [Clostridia bacterium]|nr:hypothetical protein [Clostridia bacterium]